MISRRNRTLGAICVFLAVLFKAQLSYGDEAEETCIGKPTGWLIQDPLDCHGYFVCHSGRGMQAYCDYSEKFDETKRECVKGRCPPCKKCDSTPSPTPDPNSCEGKENGYRYRDPTNCAGFFVCQGGIGTSYACPAGFYFDITLMTCNYAQLVDCSNSQTTLAPPTASPTTTSTPLPTTTSTTTMKPTSSSTTTTTTTTMKPTSSSTTTTTTRPPSSSTTTTTTTRPTSSSTTTTWRPPSTPSQNSCEGKNEGEMYRDPNDCSRYYVCTGGLATQHTCPAGLYFDTTINVCNYANLVDCKNGQIPTTSTTWRPPTTTTTTTWRPPVTTTTTTWRPPASTTTTTTWRPPSSQNSCEGRPDGEMYRDPTDCRRFYVCSGGSETLHTCPAGLYFDTTKDVCNYPYLVNCNDGQPTTTTTTWRPPVTTTTTSRPPQTTTTTTSRPSPTTTTTTTSRPSPTTPTTTSRPPSTTTTTTWRPPPSQNSCEGRHDGEMYRDPTDCRRFYVCSGGSETLHICPAGLYFDTTKDVCNYPNLVNCNDSQPTTTTTTGRPPPTATTTTSRPPSTTTTTTSRPLTTTTTTSRPATTTTTTTSRPLSTTTTTTSRPPTTTTTTTSRPPSTPNQYTCVGRFDGEMYRDPTACNRFYVCSGGSETLHTCPAGLYFDTTKNVCNYPNLVNCNDGQPTTTTTTWRPPPTTTTTTWRPPPTTTTTTSRPPTTTTTTTSRPPTTTTTTTSRPPTTTTTTTWTPPPTTTTTTTTSRPPTTTTTTTSRPPSTPNQYTCVGRFDGEMYRDPTACNRFYVCSGGSETLHTCPAGLYFDTTKNVCNYPNLVNCNDGQPTTTTTTWRPPPTTTTTTSRPPPTTTTTTSRPPTTTTTTTWTPPPTTTTTTSRPPPTTTTTTTTSRPPPTTTTTTTRQPTTTTTTTLRPSTTPSITTTTVKDGQVDPSVTDCFGRPNGSFVRNKNHCNIYYVCRDGTAVKHRCPPRWWFDDISFVCNLSPVVSCPAGQD